MELWDIYDKNRNKTGKVIDRNSNERLKEGEYHLVTEAIIMNNKGQLLLNKRAKFKQKYPLMWEFCGGSSIQGENSLKAILREAKEELGLYLNEKEAIFYKTIRDEKAKDFKDIWLFVKDIEIKDLKFIDGEVIDSKWVTIEEFKKLLYKKEIIPTIDFNEEDYKKITENIIPKIRNT